MKYSDKYTEFLPVVEPHPQEWESAAPISLMLPSI